VLVALLVAPGPACSRTPGPAPGASTTVGDATVVSDAPPPASPVVPSGAPSSSASLATANAKKWDFESDAVGAAPRGFSFGRTGRGAEGRWIVQAHAGTKVLAQVDADDTSFRFPLAIASEPVVRDVRVGVRCKMISGEVDQACGLVARYFDRDNYFVTRANSLENNVRLYTVRNGSRSEIASFSGPITLNSWHDFRFELRGDHLEVFWDGKRVIDHHDATFPDAGRTGAWTKADSITYFDDLTVEPL
jgi:hypothetical protein